MTKLFHFGFVLVLFVVLFFTSPFIQSSAAQEPGTSLSVCVPKKRQAVPTPPIRPSKSPYSSYSTKQSQFFRQTESQFSWQPVISSPPSPEFVSCGSSAWGKQWQYCCNYEPIAYFDPSGSVQVYYANTGCWHTQVGF
jgi:hypothetical protein